MFKPAKFLALLILAAAGCVPSGDRDELRRNTVTIIYGERHLYPDHDSPAKFLTFLSLTTVNEKGELEGRLAQRLLGP